MEEKENIKSEIFNLTKDTLQLKKLQKFVKNITTKLLKETNDEIPNLGFSFQIKNY